jgi:ABC-type multidrug transport system ATPase subunit
VNGIAKPGELLAIMGSSGSGKTTLLNVLNCRNKGKLSISGEIKVNGEIIRSSEDLSSITGYVQQEDLFLEVLFLFKYFKMIRKII